MPKRKPKTFTLEEANALLPDLEKRLRLLQKKKDAYNRAHDTLFIHELICAAERSNGFLNEKDDLEVGIHALEETIEELAKDVEEIFSMGCILRAIEKGHVEFLGNHQGEAVYFSWELGEPNIRYYRPLAGNSTERCSITHKNTKQKAR